MRVLIDELPGFVRASDDDLAGSTSPLGSLVAGQHGQHLDGAANGESGRSGSINNDADKLVFDALRAQADAIVVGAGTAAPRATGSRTCRW